MSDPLPALIRTLGSRCTPFAGAAIDRRHSVPWQSLLFDGARHELQLRLHGSLSEDGLAAIRDTIAAIDLAIAGHLLVDVSITDVERVDSDTLIRMEAVTVEAA